MIRRPGSRLALLAVALLLSGLGGVGAASVGHVPSTRGTPAAAAVIAAPVRPGLAPVAPHPNDVLGRVDTRDREVAGRRSLICVALVVVLGALAPKRRFVATDDRVLHERAGSVVHLRAPPRRFLPRPLTTA
jgi:hypothetical protein